MRVFRHRGHRPGRVNRFLLSNTWPQEMHRNGTTSSRFPRVARDRATWGRCSSPSRSRIPRALALSPVVVVPCSAEAYGRVDPSRCPLTEEEPFRPVSPYAVSKAAQDLMAYQVHASRGLPVIRMRPFNHTGPGRPDRFVASSFARQLAEMEAGLRPPELHVGNLDAVRDFTDVRDVVRAYRLAADRCTPGEAYHVCSGRPVAVREILEILVSLSTVEPHVVVDPERMRPADIPELWGSAEKLHRATGWAPSIPLERTLGDLLEDWRRRLAREAP